MVAVDVGSPPAWRWASLPVVVLLALCLGSGAFELHNLDWPLHDVTGQWILAHGEVPTTNVVSGIHHDHPSVHDKWAFQVLTHLLHRTWGTGGLIGLRVGLLLALGSILVLTARGLGATPWSTLLMLALVLVAARSRVSARPDLASLVLLAAFTHVALVSCPDGRGAALRLLPLQVLWTNLHGSFLLGWVVAAVVALARAGEGAAGRTIARRWAVLCVALAGASLLNPAGLDGWLHPFAILADLSAHADLYHGTIEEFRPTFAPDPRQPYDRLAFCAVAGLAGLGVGARLAKRWLASSPAPADDPRAAPWRDPVLPAFALLLAFGAMVPSLRRNMAPCAVVVAGACAAALPGWLARSRFLPPAAGLLALAILAGELTDHISIHDGLQRRTGLGLSRLAYPDAGIDFIASHLPEARVFTAFRYGSRFTGRRWPEQVASTNGNTHGYPTAWLAEVVAATADTDPTAFGRLAALHGFDAALIPMDCPLAPRLLRDPDWTLAFLGSQEAVFARRGAAPGAWWATHDLEDALGRGEVPVLPGPETRPPWGVARPAGPALRAATLLLAGGFRDLAYTLARTAVSQSPHDGQALGLAGLLAWRRGDAADARRWLTASADTTGWHPLRDDVDGALEELAGK